MTRDSIKILLLDLRPDDAYARHRFMLKEVLLECHRLLHYLVMDTGGVEQVQTIVMPHGDTDMLGIKTSDVRDDGDDIPIVDSLT